jgi:hypothetical protein
MKKTTIFIIVIVALAAIGFYLYRSGSMAPKSDTLDIQTDPEVQASATRVLNLLNQIRTLRIDGTIFKTAEYQTLQDYSVAIPPVEVGRVNPFAPIQGTVQPATATSSRSSSGTRR